MPHLPPAENVPAAGIPRQVIGQKFEGDKTAELCVHSLIDDTHPSTTQLLNNVVMRYGLANHQGQILRG